MRIVIVEDEPLIQQRIKRLTLDILNEYQPKIVYFGDIDDADDYLSEHTIDLLLLDLNLMGRDGFELLKANAAGSYH
jgi:two-component system response regulator LytT